MSKPVFPHQPDAASIADQPTMPMTFPQRALRKVPEVTIYFWIIKLLTTAMGEVTSDFLVKQIDPVIAVALGGLVW